MIVYEVTLNSGKIVRCKGINEDNALRNEQIDKYDVKLIKRLYNEDNDDISDEDDFIDTATDIITTGLALGMLLGDLDSDSGDGGMSPSNDDNDFGGFGGEILEEVALQVIGNK